MKDSKTEICGIRAECLSHICQDSLDIHQFLDENGEEVWTAALADGCSGALGSENGSAFLVKAFTEEAERLGKEGKRDGNFIRRVALTLLDRMADYQPVHPDSEIEDFDGVTVSHELSSTLYGFVADKDNILLMLSGDGFIAINGNIESINQEPDIYPIYMLHTPKETWEKNLERFFTFAEFPSQKVSDLVLASDGYCHPKIEEYPELTKNPAKFILHTASSATTNSKEIPDAYSCRGNDDATIISYAQIGHSSSNYVSAAEVKKLCETVSHCCTDEIMKKVKEAKHLTVRPSKRIAEDPMDDPSFKRNLPILEGVHILNVPPESFAEYERERDSIIASRIQTSEADVFMSLFGKKKSNSVTSHLKGTHRKPVHNKTTRTLRVDLSKKNPVPEITEIPQNNTVKVTMTPIRIDENVSRTLVEKNEPEADTNKTAVETAAGKKAKETVAKTDKPSSKKTKMRTVWVSFGNLCNHRRSKKTGVGFRHFGQVMFDLWHFVDDYHKKGMRIGNLRPKDLKIGITYEGKPGKRFEKTRKPVGFQFELVHPKNSARVDGENILVKNYKDLDLDFIYPDYADKLETDDKPRLNQDWYAFSVLCIWFVTKFDPFGEGIVKEKPDADRKYRMENVILSQSSKVEVDEWKRTFIDRAVRRLNPNVKDLIYRFNDGWTFLDSPDFLLEEFRDKNIVTCNAEICRKKRGIKTKREPCGFKQLKGFSTCGYCRAQLVKMLSSSSQLYQTEDQAVTS